MDGILARVWQDRDAVLPVMLRRNLTLELSR
jgi:hypothetical protein